MARRMEDHFDDSDEEDSCQCDGAGDSWIILGPEVAEAWVSKRDESSREKMNKRRGNENTSTEMSNSEEESVGDPQTGELGGQNRESTGESRNTENDEQSTDMERRVVGIRVDTSGGAGRSSSLEKSCELNGGLRSLNWSLNWGSWNRSGSVGRGWVGPGCHDG